MCAMRKVCLAATLVFMGLTSSSLACQGPKSIYSDDFQEQDAGWFIQPADTQSGRIAVGQGRILIKPQPRMGYTLLNLAFGLPADTDICVKARIVELTDLSKSGVGLVFWAKGYADNYLFQAQGDGMYFVSHFVDRTWQTVTPTAKAATFKTSLGQDNLLRVVTKAQTVTLYVNDEQVAKFRAPAPDGLVKAGFRASSLGDDPTGAEFRSYSVTNVP